MDNGGKTHTQEVEERMYRERLEEMLRSGDPLQKGKAIRLLTGEYGVTSKRPRRLGMTDAMHLRIAAQINGLRGIFLTKLDCLNLHGRDGKGIPMVTGYELDGRGIDYPPSSATALRRVRPIITESEPYPHDISEVRVFSDLPNPAQRYVEVYQEKTGMAVFQLGVGPKRHQVIPTNGWTASKQ
jgi:adenylosuccinate synthase